MTLFTQIRTYNEIKLALKYIKNVNIPDSNLTLLSHIISDIEYYDDIYDIISLLINKGAIVTDKDIENISYSNISQEEKNMFYKICKIKI